MFHHSSRLQYEVRVDTPDPQFAKFLQQAIGGIEGAKGAWVVMAIVKAPPSQCFGRVAPPPTARLSSAPRHVERTMRRRLA